MFEGRITEMWIEHLKSRHVTFYTPEAGVQPLEIPVGLKWHLHVVTEAAWPDNPDYSTGVSVFGDIVPSPEARYGGGNFTFEYDMGVMPEYPLTFGVKFWKNPIKTNVPPPQE